MAPNKNERPTLTVKTILVNEHQVRQLLPMAECISVMEDVLAALARGECQLPLRQIMWLPNKSGALGLMPSYWHSTGFIGLKAVTFFPGNEGSELDTHQGAVMLFDGERGRLRAIVDATTITAIRTAAVSGVATKLLAREDGVELAILGSGVQARAHLEAMLLCRSIVRVKVFSKLLAHSEQFAESASRRHSLPVQPVRLAEEAVQEADIICTTTSAREPVLEGEWLKPGTHVNAVGSSVAFARELDGMAVRRSRLFVDRRESALNEAGDIVLAMKEGLVVDDHILGELGELLIGTVSGRRSPADITLFKSVGLAVEDLAAALHVYNKALATGVGTSIELGGTRYAAD